MPNWCEQEVYIHGETSMVVHLYWELKERKRFCDVVCPIPLEVIGQGHDGKGTSPQYDWRCNKWNTKWEVQAEYEVEGTDCVGEFTLGEHHCRTLSDEEIKEREARWEEENA